MAPTKKGSQNNTRKGKSATLSLVESPQKKTESEKLKEQTEGLSTSGSEKTSQTKISASAKGNGSNGMPVPKALVKRNVEALRRLRVNPKTLAAAPQITPLLKQASGGIKNVLIAMRLVSSQDEVITSFLRKYDAVPVVDRRHLSLEAIALAAGLDITQLLGAIMLALQAQSVNTVKLIAVTNHPKITQARVTYGMLPAGERDRTALDTAMGFLPSPKGPTFIGKAIFGSGRDVMDQQGVGGGETEGALISGEDEPDLEKLFPPANAMQEKLVAIRQRMLPQSTS